MEHHRDFRCHLIRAINDRMDTGRQTGRDILRRQKVIDRRDHALWIDRQDALRHGKHLRLAKGLGQRMHLPIHIRLSDMIKIDERQGANAATRQRLSRPGTYATYANHRDMRPPQVTQCLQSIQTHQATESALNIVRGHTRGFSLGQGH
jgi:hypothetical protein